jgi:RNA polymerase sigma-70 factor (sigma-E family)
VTVVEPRETDQVLAGLFRQHHAELVRLAVLLTRDQATAEDAVQDVYLRLQARHGRLGREGEELAYIRACVLNGCRSMLRRRNRARLLGGELSADLLPGESAESAVIRSEERRQVLIALAALPARRREVLVLRYYLDLSEAEIATTLGISNGSVKSAAARGLAALARTLGEERP